MRSKIEHCKNPWKRNCNSPDIVMYIMKNGKRYPICSKCWVEIAEGDYEWSGEEN